MILNTHKSVEWYIGTPGLARICENMFLLGYRTWYTYKNSKDDVARK